jgi:hypothetical protein
MKLLAPSLLLLLGLAALPGQAKLPPLSPEAQAKADEAKAKTAWTDKVAAYQLCKSMDRVAESYFKRVKAAGPAASAPGAPVTTAPCADPGLFVAPAPAASKPLEAAGAHSPPATAATPPSNKATQAELQGAKK